jgi:hypothetical protein
MPKEITITLNAQVTAIDRLTDEQYAEAVSNVGGNIENWKEKIRKNFAQFIKDEAPADDVVISDVKIFERDITEEAEK